MLFIRRYTSSFGQNPFRRSMQPVLDDVRAVALPPGPSVALSASLDMGCASDRSEALDARARDPRRG
jgi:hypothetical protein